MTVHIDSATITSISTDSGASGDFVTTDNTLSFSGSVTAVHGSGSGTIGVWISGGSFGTAHGGKGTLVGSSSISGTGAWTVDGTATTLGDDTGYTIHITDGTWSGASDLASHGLTVDTTAPSKPTALDLDAADDAGPSNTDNITSVTSGLTISGLAETGATVSLFDDADNSGSLDNGETVLATTTAVGGAFSADIALTEGKHFIRAFQTDAACNPSQNSDSLVITVDTTAPSAPTALDLAAADDTGPSNTDNITHVASFLTIGGGAETDATVSLFDDADGSGLMDNGETVLATTTADGGAFSADIALTDGTHHIRAFQVDPAGHVSANSDALDVTVDTVSPSKPTALDLDAADDTGTSDTDNLTRNMNGLTVSGLAETGATVSLFDDADNSGSMDNGETVLTTTTAIGGAFSADIALTEGTHLIRAFQTDAAGNPSQNSDSLVITVDTTAPTAAVAITAIADDSGTSGDFITNDTSLTVSGTHGALGACEKVQVSSDGGATWSDVTTSDSTPWSFTDPTAHSASFTYQARVVDTSGNANTASQAVTIDTAAAAPTALVLDAADDSGTSDSDGITSNTSGLTIGGGAETGATVSLFDDADNSGLLDNGETVIATTTAAGSAFTADISLAEGTHHIRAFQTDVAGNVSAVSSSLDITVDTNADEVPAATLAVDPLISANDMLAGVSYTVAGLDGDATAVVSFTDGSTTLTDNVSGNGTFTVDLTGLVGTVTSSLAITDTAGNTASVAGNASIVNLTPDLALTVAQYRSWGPAPLADYTNVTILDSGFALFHLTPGEIGDLVGNGIDVLQSTSSSWVLNVAQYRALGAVVLAGDVWLYDSEAAIETLSVAEIANLAGNGIDRINVTDNALTLSVAKYQALGAVALTGSDMVTLADTGAALQALSAGAIGALAGKGIDRIDSTTDTLSLSAAQYLALGKVALSGSDAVTLADTGANLAALTYTQIAGLAGKGVSKIDATDDVLSLTVKQYQSLGTVALTDLDTVTLSDTGSNLQALTATQIAGLAGKGVDGIDATNNVLALRVDQYQALGSVLLSAGDVVTLQDTGAALGGLLAADAAALAGNGIDKINATDDVLSLTVAQYQALGAVTLTSTDVVTLSDEGSVLAGLSAADIGALRGRGIDKIDATDDVMSLGLDQFKALSSTILSTTDALTLTGTDGSDSFSFSLQTFAVDDSIVGGLGSDTLTLSGDYSALAAFGPSTLVGVERINLVAGHSYSLTPDDANVAAGQQLYVDASKLGASDAVTVDGSAETDGKLKFTGGAGANSFTGGNGGDTITAGTGVDTFHYTAASQSTGSGYDTITGFNTDADEFAVVPAVTGVDSAIGGALSLATFDVNMAAAANAAHLLAHHAAVFTATAGNLMNQTFLVVDLNGTDGYQAGADLAIKMVGTTGTNPLGTGNFS